MTTGTPNSATVTLHWVNDNVAPTHLAWKVFFVLRGALTVPLPMNVDLRTVMPDAPLDSSETLVAAALPAGTYDALVRVEDAQGISPPMFLARQGRDNLGNYLLGRIQVP